MFTKNWYKILGVHLFRKSIDIISVNGTTITAATNNLTSLVTSLADTSSTQYYNAPFPKMVTTFADDGGVIIGTGTTPPTIDDYTLSGDIITTFAYSSTPTIVRDDNGVTLTVHYTITNTGSNAFTIGEMGLISNPTSTTSGSKTYKALLERTVLDTPITVEAGGVGQLTYTVTFNYPTA